MTELHMHGAAFYQVHLCCCSEVRAAHGRSFRGLPAQEEQR